ncbi:amino acid adenylation domain-containing protein [Streptomyces sp. YIM 132580]|uniref:amino acid adenylation domain-containing protein n=1 Tax=Streptomyces sp. YIM 132580 TaxID=2691958 RepID=UPI00136F65DB|nr:amino acid adenylation domain-containing protein [Streptomyces sp. YIM 132580]
MANDEVNDPAQHQTYGTAGAADRAAPAVRLTDEDREQVAEAARHHGVAAPAVLLAALLATRFRRTRRENAEVRLAPDGGHVVPVTVTGDLTFAELLRTAGQALSDGAPATAPAGEEAAGTVERLFFHPAGTGTPASHTVEAGERYAAGTVDEDVRAAAWADHYVTLLLDGVRHPGTTVDRLALLTPAQQAEAVAAADTGHEEYPGLRPIHLAFEEAARRDPGAVAVEAGGRSATYGELDGRANLLARSLADAGIGAGSLVAVSVERSPELVVALLAVLRLGAAFVPLEPSLPAERIAVITADARAAAVVVRGEETVRLRGLGIPLVEVPTTGSAEAPQVEVRPEHAAYVYYTSGSTGTPKGTVLDHRCAAGRLEWLGRRYGLRPGDRVVHKTPLIFDVAIWEIFGPLSAGATILMADPGAESDVVHLSRLLSTERTVFAHFVPSMLDAYLSLAPEAACPDLRWVQLSGEAASVHLLERFAERFDAELHNLYGQTETSEVAGWEGRSYEGTGGLPIGRALGIYRLLVLDEALRPVPAGFPGELCVAGTGGLARGYLNRPGQTADRFVPHPCPLTPGERLYRTGDLVARDGDGEIRYLGRVDDQVKIRGCRVETGEVEAVLRAHPALRACAVTVFQDEDGAAQLAAYVVGEGQEPVPVGELAAFAEERLPVFMLPAVYVPLPELPHTPSGKLDRLRLPAPTLEDRQARAGAEEPQSPLEEQVVALWKEVLGIENVGRTDSFFTVGGNSLKSLQLLNRVNTTFEVQVSVRSFFANPTVEGVADAVEAALFELVAGLSDEEAAKLLSNF